MWLKRAHMLFSFLLVCQLAHKRDLRSKLFNEPDRYSAHRRLSILTVDLSSVASVDL